MEFDEDNSGDIGRESITFYAALNFSKGYIWKTRERILYIFKEIP